MQTAIHELRNHLCVAMAGIEAFLDHKLEPNAARLNAIFAALRAVDGLIDDLPHGRSAQFEMHAIPIDVCLLIARQICAMEGLACKRDIRLTVDRCAAVHGGMRFVGDPLRIAEIVTNVMLNAIQHTPPGGEVCVRYRCDSTSIRLSVSDEGPGIAAAERTRIFENGFRSAAAPSPSHGIGLAVVKRFVDGQGGTIAVSDGPLGGAAFTIDLPAFAPPQDDARSEWHAVASRSG